MADDINDIDDTPYQEPEEDEEPAAQPSAQPSSPIPGFSSSLYGAFKGYMAQRESGGRYNTPPNREGYMGKYQMGAEEINQAANDVGITQPFTQTDFLGNPQLQERLFDAYTQRNHTQLMQNPTYAGASPEDRAAILAGAHLGGVGGVNRFLTTGQDRADRLGTHISDYVYDTAHHLYALAGRAEPAGSQEDPAAKQKLDAAVDAFSKASGPTGGGAFDHQPLPPTQRSPTADPLGDAMSNFEQASRPTSSSLTMAPGQQEQPKVLDKGTVGSAFAEIPRGLLRGAISDNLGLPADIANWLGPYYAVNPHDPAPAGDIGELGERTAAMQDWLAQGQQDPLAAYDPNSGGAHLPLGSQDITKAIKYATGIDLNPQDNSTGAEVLGHMAEFIGAGLTPGGMAHDIGELARGAAKVPALVSFLFHHILAPAGISGGLDAGEWATQGSPTGEAIGIGARAALGGAAILALSRGGRTGSDFIQNAPKNAIDQALAATPGTDLAAAKATALENLGSYQEPVPGYQTPPPLRTGSAPLQQFFRNLMEKEGQVKNDFITNIAPRNVTAMEGMRPEGDATDAVTAVRNQQDARQKMINTRLLQAQDAAQQAEQIASKSSSGAPLVAGGPRGQTNAFDLGNAVTDEVRAARDDTAAHVDDQWDVARQQGLTNTPIQPKPMYSALEGLIGENIRLQRGGNFPYDIVNSLYEDGNPRGMFSKLGARDAATIGTNQLYGEGTTIEQARGVDSQLGNAIRMEQDRISTPGNGGNPTLLRNLYRVQNVVKQAIDDAAVAGGNQMALRSALDASAQYHQTFDHGLVARILNEQGGATNAPKILHDFLGNTSNAIQAADMFQKVMAQRTGAAAARLNTDAVGQPGPAGATPAQQFSQTLADWMRQDYLNFRGDSTTAATGSRRWLVNHAGFFERMTGNPDFDKLHQELMGYSHITDELLPQVQQAAKRDQATIDNSVAQHFLGGDAGPRLDAVFKSPNPGAAMQELINDTLQDGTGRGFKGLQGMVFDRVMHEAETGDPLRPDQTYYSFKKAEKFLNQPAVQKAFDVLRQADPQTQGRIDRLVEALATEDRSRLDTGLQLPAPGMLPGSGNGLTRSLITKIGQYAGVHFIGRNLPAAGIQGPGLVSEYTKELMNSLPANLQQRLGGLDPATAVLSALREATLYDPEKFRGLMASTTGPSGQKWARGIEPWLKASGVMIPQGWLQPQDQGQGNSNSP